MLSLSDKQSLVVADCQEHERVYDQKKYRISSKFVDCRSPHSYQPFNIKTAKTFIVGSIPPYRFCASPKQLLCGDVDWYYGSKDNHFWDIVKCACGLSSGICTVEGRQQFLCEKDIGMFDMICECTRKDCSSSDGDLYNIELIDACKIIRQNKNCKRIFFTSRFVADLFCWQSGAKLDLTSREIQKLSICDKELEVTILYSPSRQWSRGLDKKIREDPNKEQIRIEQYEKIFTISEE